MKKDFENAEYLSNREKTLMPRRALYWCNYCDGNMVSPGGTCSYCRKKDIQRRLRK